MKRLAPFFLFMLLLLSLSFALGETAPDLTAGCSFFLGDKPVDEKRQQKLLDDDYTTYYTLRAGKTLNVKSTEELSALELKLFDWVPHLTLETSRDGENWLASAKAITHLTDWYVLPEGTKYLRFTSGEVKKNLWIAEFRVYGSGEKPESIHLWQDLEKADLLLVVAHPDDEILWFGGLLPTYAGERGLAVQVAHMVPTGGERKLELLDALWTCGVHNYPYFMNLIDKNAGTLEGMYNKWGGKSVVVGKMTQLFRRYKPEVVITHGEKGEYGHGAHIVACDACKIAYKNAANPKKSAKSYEQYGTWQVKKLYLHEYTQNSLQLDWHVPLNAFGGKDAYAVAEEAMACHASQIARGWALEDHGDHDNSIFGLYYTEVGQDSDKNDLMEHINIIN